MDREPKTSSLGISRWQIVLLVLVGSVGILPPLQILGFMAKAPSLETPLEFRWGCYYPLLWLAATAATFYSVADERRRRLTWRAIATLLSLLLLFPVVEGWCACFQANTRLIPPYSMLYAWLPPPVNLFALATTVRLSRRAWVRVIAAVALGVAILTRVTLPSVWPIVERIRRQYPPAREILALGQADIAPTLEPHMLWDDFWVIRVWARETWMGDGRAERIYEFPRLQLLDLSGTFVSDVGMRHIDTLRRLEKVDLGRTRVGDQTVEKLSRLPNLCRLELDGTAVTDAGLEHLIHLKELRALSLGDTQVTPEAVKRFVKRYEEKTGRRCDVSYTAPEAEDS